MIKVPIMDNKGNKAMNEDRMMVMMVILGSGCTEE